MTTEQEAWRWQQGVKGDGPGIAARNVEGWLIPPDGLTPHLAVIYDPFAADSVKPLLDHLNTLEAKARSAAKLATALEEALAALLAIQAAFPTVDNTPKLRVLARMSIFTSREALREWQATVKGGEDGG